MESNYLSDIVSEFKFKRCTQKPLVELRHQIYLYKTELDSRALINVGVVESDIPIYATMVNDFNQYKKFYLNYIKKL